jgi:hypothetical protein
MQMKPSPHLHCFLRPGLMDLFDLRLGRVTIPQSRAGMEDEMGSTAARSDKLLVIVGF